MPEVEEKTAKNSAPSDSFKPRIVRNREVDKEASKLAEEHIVPLPPGKLINWDQMQKYFELLTPGMWAHISCYVYRVYPKIRRQLKNPSSPNYIDVFGQPFTMDYFISRHGGGKYQIQVNDTEAKGDANQLFKCNFDINDVQHPPLLDPEELDFDAKENKSYIQWLQNTKVIDGQGKPIKPAEPASSATNLSAKEVLDILTFSHKMSSDQQAQFRQQFPQSDDSLSKSVGQILLEKMKQDDPGKDFDRMLAWSQAQMATMEKLFDRTNKPDNSFAQLLQMQAAQTAAAAEQRKTDLEYTRLLLDTSARHENSPRNQLGELRELVGFVREIIGTTGKAGARSGWDVGLEIARDVALPAVTVIGNIIKDSMALRSTGAPAAAAAGARPPVPAAFDPYRSQQTMRDYAQQQQAQQQPPPQPAPGPAPAPQPPPQQPQPADAEAQLLHLFKSYGNLIVNHLNNNTTGYDFADYVSGLLGVSTHAMIAQHGEEMLIQTMLKIPEIAIFSEPRIRTFVTEFVHYQEYLESAQDDEAEDGPIVDAPREFKPRVTVT